MITEASHIPNAAAETEDFEFLALSEARNYPRAMVREFEPALRGSVIEIGAGIGQMTTLIKPLPAISRLLSIEPHAPFAARFREAHPGAELIEGTIANAPAEAGWDAIISINVLEHIQADEAELASYRALLAPKRGALCLFVPAGPGIYAPIDRDFGHFRRYTRPELKGKLERAGFTVERLYYYNWLGYFAWWANFCVLKKRGFEIAKVRAFDRMIFPVVHAMETSIARPPFGQSLLAIARAS
jgi:SAM-dependent methyltransferase